MESEIRENHQVFRRVQLHAEWGGAVPDLLDGRLFRVRGQSPILHRYNLHPSKNLAISRNSDPKGIIWAADQARPRAREIYREEEVMAICAAALDHSGSTDYRPQ
jgi:hypothetical protein